jgi:hypothetical protein
MEIVNKQIRLVKKKLISDKKNDVIIRKAIQLKTKTSK